MATIEGKFYYLTDYPRWPMIDRLRVAEDFRKPGWYRVDTDQPISRADQAEIAEFICQYERSEKARQQDRIDNLEAWEAKNGIL